MTSDDFRKLATLVVSYSAQLLYSDRSEDARRLLLAADRLFRSLAAKSGPSPLEEELLAARALIDIGGIVAGVTIEFELELDPETLSSVFIPAGALVDAVYSFAGEGPGLGFSDARLVLSETSEESGFLLILRGMDRLVSITGSGKE